RSAGKCTPLASSATVRSTYSEGPSASRNENPSRLSWACIRRMTYSASARSSRSVIDMKDPWPFTQRWPEQRFERQRVLAVADCGARQLLEPDDQPLDLPGRG